MENSYLESRRNLNYLLKLLKSFDYLLLDPTFLDLKKGYFVYVPYEGLTEKFFVDLLITSDLRGAKNLVFIIERILKRIPESFEFGSIVHRLRPDLAYFSPAFVAPNLESVCKRFEFGFDGYDKSVIYSLFKSLERIIYNKIDRLPNGI